MATTKPGDRVLLSKTRINGHALNVEFLESSEIENYLLEAKAIHAAITEEHAILQSTSAVDIADIDVVLRDCRKQGIDKGSVILSEVYSRYGLKYDKIG